MFYLGIDQHARQLTISLRNEEGDVLEARQVSTEPKKVNAFFRAAHPRDNRERGILRHRARSVRLQRLADADAQRLPLPQSDSDPARRTQEAEDRPARRRGAERTVMGQPAAAAGGQARPRSPPGRHLVRHGPGEPTAHDAPQGSRSSARPASSTRSSTSSAATICSGRCRPRRSQREWQSPGSRDSSSRRLIAWNSITCWRTWSTSSRRMMQLEQVLARALRLQRNRHAAGDDPGVGRFTATALACRIGRVERFPRARSLANYWGLTPGCRNSGEYRPAAGQDHQGRQRHGPLAAGPIGSSKCCARIGSCANGTSGSNAGGVVGIARVAVMRKLATIIWHMVSQGKTYGECRVLINGMNERIF